MSCTPPTVTVDGVILSTSDFQNAQELLTTVSNAGGDPTLDEYEENVANGNNTAKKSGILLPNTPEGTIPKQTTLPPPIPQKAAVDDTKTPPGSNGASIGCTIWTEGDYDAPLSPNFRLRQFTTKAVFPYPLTDYAGFSKQTRFCNLQNLAVNVAEPLRAKFGTFSINSGLRNKTSTSSGISQHITGQAFDAQFSGWTYARYWENAQWVRDNIPYDQFIFEHSSLTGLAWFHLSYNKSGNRSPDVRTKVMTMYRNNYSPGLHRYG